MKQSLKMTLAGICAGAINGLFGAGGGMVLVPLLSSHKDIQEEEIFPSSVSIILPICLVSLIFSAVRGSLPFGEAFPYLLGSIGGGIAAGITGNKIPVKWLHRGLGVLILLGGIRYLC